jgi:hypothetical protein
MLVKALLRAREIFRERELPASPALAFFLRKDISKIHLNQEDETGKTPADWFIEIDDNDVICALKQWAYDKDTVLSVLCRRIINRDLFKVEIQTKPFDPQKIETLRKETAKKHKLSEAEAEYWVFSDTISNKAYSIKKSASINILQKSGSIKDIADASDISNIKTLSETVEKYFICYPKL